MLLKVIVYSSRKIEQALQENVHLFGQNLFKPIRKKIAQQLNELWSYVEHIYKQESLEFSALDIENRIKL